MKEFGDRIFTIEVYYFEKDKENFHPRRERMWGYFFDYETAEECIMRNNGDMYEMGAL